VLLRSDVIRKSLMGREPSERLPPESYKAEASRRVFAEIARRAKTLLMAGHSVIADGVYGEPEQRAEIEAVAREAGSPFLGLWLSAPESVLESRVAARRGDASDADVAVVRLQRAINEASVHWRRLSADRPPAELATQARGLIEES
jgi:predicted kinase